MGCLRKKGSMAGRRKYKQRAGLCTWSHVIATYTGLRPSLASSLVEILMREMRPSQAHLGVVFCRHVTEETFVSSSHHIKIACDQLREVTSH